MSDELADRLARLFHETYERYAPDFGYETRKDSAVPWEDVPQQNKDLMVAVADHVLDQVLTLIGTYVDGDDDAECGRDAIHQLVSALMPRWLKDLDESDSRPPEIPVLNGWVLATHVLDLEGSREDNGWRVRRHMAGQSAPASIGIMHDCLETWFG